MAEPLITQFGSSFDAMAYYIINAHKPFATCREMRVRLLLVARSHPQKTRVGRLLHLVFQRFLPQRPGADDAQDYQR